MPDRTDLDARLDAIAAQMPRFREDLDRVFADIGEWAGPRPAEPATDPQPRRDRPGAKVERATRH